MVTKVAYLGPDAVTFGYMAAEKYCDKQKKVNYLPFKSHAEIILAVGRQEASHGVVAIENYIDGAISETIRALDKNARKLGVRICGEVIIPIEHFLLHQVNGGDLPKKVLSHPSALRQCSQYLDKLMNKGISVEAVDSTGTAAEMATKNPDIAAIGSVKAQKLYGLVRVEDNSIADLTGNVTRFWIVSNSFAPRTGKDKTAFLVNLEQEAVGVVYRSLGYFAQEGISLLWFHADPIEGRHWEYTFLFEFKGHITDEPMSAAVDNLTQSGLCLGGPLMLGSWPDMTSPA